jgi:hypothetical protein
LNVGAIGVATLHVRPAGPIRQATTQATVLLLTSALPPPLTAAPLQPLKAHPPTLQDSKNPPDPAPQEGRPAPHIPTASAALSAPQSGDTASQVVRFYTFQEVDRAAEPETDWPIDIATLDAIGIERLVFEVMVDDRGSVIRCTVLDPSGLPDAARIDLEQRLAATALQPALRGGRFVASQRRIELLVEPST